MSSKRFPLEILINVKKEKLKILKEKMQEIKLKVFLLEESYTKILNEKKDFENHLRQKRKLGDLKERVKEDEQWVFLCSQYQLAKEDKKKWQELLSKHQEELMTVLNEKRRFEKLKEKRFVKTRNGSSSTY